MNNWIKKRGAALARRINRPSYHMGQASVIDGDTLEIHGQRIQLSDIDAPKAAPKNQFRWVCTLHSVAGNEAENIRAIYVRRTRCAEMAAPVGIVAVVLDLFRRDTKPLTGLHDAGQTRGRLRFGLRSDSSRVDRSRIDWVCPAASMSNRTFRGLARPAADADVARMSGRPGTRVRLI